MINAFQPIFLGAIQGLTEFLPISSSGHLILVPWLFKWKESGLSFDIALHLGTVIAIVAYFWKDWLEIITNAISRKSGVGSRENKPISALPLTSHTLPSYPKNFLWQIVVATIPAAVLGYIFDELTENFFRSNIVLISLNLIVFGLLLWLTDKYARKSQKPGEITYKQSFLIGLSQAIALIPGVSRSGITMTTSRAIGLKREEAACFSFLLATPTMVGAFLFKLKDIVANDLNLAFFLGVLSSAIFGLLTIKYLLQYLKRGNFSVFVWYRIILAVLILAIYFAK